MPDCRMGAVIMKMMSSTSTMSMNGTMLISEREVCVDLEREGMALREVDRRQFKVKSEIHLNVWIASSWGAAVLRPYWECGFAEMATQFLLLAESLFDLGGHFQCKCVEALSQVFYVLQELIVEDYGGNGGGPTRRGGWPRARGAGGGGGDAWGAAGVAPAARVHAATPRSGL